jgi:hypothetical protein
VFFQLHQKRIKGEKEKWKSFEENAILLSENDYFIKKTKNLETMTETKT